MEFENLILIISDKPDVERDAVADAWEKGGGEVLRLGRFWEPPKLDPHRVRVYGSDSFSLVLAQIFGLHLISPADNLLAQLDHKWLKRGIQVTDLGSIAESHFPRFIKPVIPKLFRADVYESLDGMRRECKGLEPETAVIISEIVNFTAEARCFVLDKSPVTCAVYEGAGDVSGAMQFISDLARDVDLPDTCVLDAGLINAREWALVEANATWGSGLNGCDAAKAAICISKACCVESE